MEPSVQVTERFFTAAEAERFLRRRERRRWATRMGLATVVVAVLVFMLSLGKHFCAMLWLTMLGANVDWDLNKDNWTQGGVTSVSFSVDFRANGRFNNRDVASLRGLKHLESLDLSNAFDVSALGLADLKKLPDIKVLDLGRIEDQASPVTAPPPKFFDGDLVHLRPLTGLRELYLGGNRITDEGLAHLAGLTNLVILDLEETDVTDAGLHHLRGLTNLKELRLAKANGAKPAISPNAAMELRRALPDVVIDLRTEDDPE